MGRIFIDVCDSRREADEITQFRVMAGNRVLAEYQGDGATASRIDTPVGGGIGQPDPAAQFRENKRAYIVITEMQV